MRSEVKEAEDSGGKRERKKRGMQRAAVWWESGRRGRLGSAPLGGHPGDRAASKGLAGRTGAARSCRDTAKPSGWQGAQKSAWMLSIQTLFCSAL